MRIVAGDWKGRPLLVPRSGTRPTADRVRQIMFDILGERIVGARVLDLFSGTGALGLEALSRGAADALFVESSRSARDALQRNCSALGASARCRIVALPVGRALSRLEIEGERFRLILADPPYGGREALQVLKRVGRPPCPLLASEGEVVIESDRRDALPERSGSLERLRRRDVGDTTLHFFGIVPFPEPPADSDAAASGLDGRRRSAQTGGGSHAESGV